MIIPEDMLKNHNAVYREYNKNDYIFYEDDKPDFYYQVIKGSVKMSSFSLEGKEFIQGIFRVGQCFGEAAILGHFPYPNNALAMEDSLVARLPSDVFLEILKDHFEIHQKFNRILAERLRYKAMLLKEISGYQPDHILLTLMNYIRKVQGHKSETDFQIPYTRQQLADMSGLRVETVIRTIKRLEKEGKLFISEHKIYLKK